MFSTASEIRKCADELIHALSDLTDTKGKTWTQENFERLETFAKQKYPAVKCHYRNYFDRSEFLWDFIAFAPELGIFLAAESEQEVENEHKVQALKHDFEKLLYVYAPIRILITKARDSDHARELADKLANYAHTCCLAFNPGAVFILHFGLWYEAGNICYIWQSEGDPREVKTELIQFQACG